MRQSLCLEPVSTETVFSVTTARLKGMEGKARAGRRALGAVAPFEVMANINKVEKWVTGLGGWRKTAKL